MYQFNNPGDVERFITDAINAALSEHRIVGWYQNKCRLYDMGSQWLSANLTSAQALRLDRTLTNWKPDSGPIRATINRITKHTRGVAAATKPRLMEFDADPTARSPGPEDFFAASIVESSGNAMATMANLMDVAQRANNERTVAGMHGIGLSMENPSVGYDGQTIQDARVRAFDFDTTRLTLDPFNNSPDLKDHDYVIYSDVWTVHKIRREFGDKALEGIQEDRMPTIASLMPIEMRFHSISGGSLYWNYAIHSKSRGAKVHFLYCRHPSGRFDRMYKAVELPPMTNGLGAGQVMRIVNFEAPENPWGGTGMPMVLLMGHFRAGTRHAISDVGMMIDDQDKLNLLASVWFQSLYNFTNDKWLVDSRWFGDKALDTQQIEQALRNRVVIGKNGTKDSHHMRPVIEKMPVPDMNIEAMTRAFAEDIREQSFRSEQDVGRLKSHVTTSQLVATHEMSRQVLDDRIADDMAKYAQLGQVLASTGIRESLGMRPTILARMMEFGMGQDEFAAMQSMDPDRPGATIVMRSGSLRHRSRDQRKQDLDAAVVAQAVDPVTYRRTLASEIGIPVSEMDREIVEYGKRQARSVIAGNPVELRPLGPMYAQMVIDELTRAMTSREASRVPGAGDRLSEAIQEIQMTLAPPAGAAPEQAPADDESVALAQLGAAFEGVA